MHRIHRKERHRRVQEHRSQSWESFRPSIRILLSWRGTGQWWGWRPAEGPTLAEVSQLCYKRSLDGLTEEEDDRDDESWVEVESGGAVGVVELGRLLDVLPVHLLHKLHGHV